MAVDNNNVMASKDEKIIYVFERSECETAHGFFVQKSGHQSTKREGHYDELLRASKKTSIKQVPHNKTPALYSKVSFLSQYTYVV